jgi:hypothetical protein
LARRWLERMGREAQCRRGNMTDEEVEAVVKKAIQESRAETARAVGEPVTTQLRSREARGARLLGQEAGPDRQAKQDYEAWLKSR